MPKEPPRPHAKNSSRQVDETGPRGVTSRDPESKSGSGLTRRCILYLAGKRLRRYRRSHALELDDALIGASALQHGERLATFNRRHYPGISRLTVPDR